MWHESFFHVGGKTIQNGEILNFPCLLLTFAARLVHLLLWHPWPAECSVAACICPVWVSGPGCRLELETKAIRRFAKVSIVSYSRRSLTIIASASQFHVYLPWGQCPFRIVSYSCSVLNVKVLSTRRRPLRSIVCSTNKNVRGIQSLSTCCRPGIQHRHVLRDRGLPGQ